MRRFKWIRVIAVIGVLLHAGALVRHHAIVLAHGLGQDQLAADLLLICRGGADTSSSDGIAHKLPSPKPSDGQSNCPICTGHAPAFALATPALPVAVPPAFTGFDWTDAYRVLLVQRSAVCPPARGPPTIT